MSLAHLYPSTVDVLRLVDSPVNGLPTYNWVAVKTGVKCRLDLNFVRPGKDVPPPQEAGRAPDRYGVGFFDAPLDLRSGDRVRTRTGPVVGTFMVQAVPDPAVAFSVQHHLEASLLEVAQAIAGPPS